MTVHGSQFGAFQRNAMKIARDEIPGEESINKKLPSLPEWISETVNFTGRGRGRVKNGPAPPLAPPHAIEMASIICNYGEGYIFFYIFFTPDFIGGYIQGTPSELGLGLAGYLRTLAP